MRQRERERNKSYSRSYSHPAAIAFFKAQNGDVKTYQSDPDVVTRYLMFLRRGKAVEIKT